jgi:Bacterial RNA polymerase, alpha chain C terminal domain/Sigma-70, region 4
MPAKAVVQPEELDRTPVEYLDFLSVRRSNALRAGGVRTAGELLRASDADLLRLKNFGPRSLRKVREGLREFPGTIEVTAAGSGESTACATGRGRSAEDSPGVRRNRGAWQAVPNADENLDVSTDALDLSLRSRNVLQTLKIGTLAKLLAYSKSDLLEAKNLGSKSLAEIEAKLVRYFGRDRHGPAEAGIKGSIQGMLGKLTKHQRKVIAQRYGLWDQSPKTLQDIGDKMGVTRERVRQIAAMALKRLRRTSAPGIIRNFFRTASARINEAASTLGGVLSEEEVLAVIGGDCSREQTVLALALMRDLHCPGENLLTKHLSQVETGVYCLEKASAKAYEELLQQVERRLEAAQKPLTGESLCAQVLAQPKAGQSPDRSALLRRILAVSPSLARFRGGEIVRSQWSVFRGRNAASLAEVALRVFGQPAHFREITRQARNLFPELDKINEAAIYKALMLRRDRFVRVDRGTYALVAWGAKYPFVKERLIEVLSQSPHPLPLWRINAQVLEVYNCSETYIRRTLNRNPKIFKQLNGDQYGLRKQYK